MYDSDTSEIFYSQSRSDGSKTFVIDHPLKEDHYLIHACLEGPEAGVYYRGKGEILEGDEKCVICLPEYTTKLCQDLSIQVTAIGKVRYLGTSEINNNSFEVYGKGCFYWTVIGKRNDILVECKKDKFNLHNIGPYTWLDK
jgi:nitrate reductase beta subunit